MSDTKSHVLDQFVTAFGSLILHNPQDHDEYETKGQTKLRELASKCIEHYAPIRMVMPGFPHKNPTQGRCLGHAADGAEAAALEVLHGFCAEVKRFYPPGCELLVLSDGRVWAHLTNVPRAHYERYAETVRSLNKEIHLTFAAGGGAAQDPSKSYLQHQSRTEAVEASESKSGAAATTSGLQNDHRIRKNPIMFASLDAYLTIASEESVDSALEKAFGIDRGYVARTITPNPSPFPSIWPWSATGYIFDDSKDLDQSVSRRGDTADNTTTRGDSSSPSALSSSSTSKTSTTTSATSLSAQLCLCVETISEPTLEYLSRLPIVPYTAFQYIKAMFSLINEGNAITLELLEPHQVNTTACNSRNSLPKASAGHSGMRAQQARQLMAEQDGHLIHHHHHHHHHHQHPHSDNHHLKPPTGVHEQLHSPAYSSTSSACFSGAHSLAITDTGSRVSSAVTVSPTPENIVEAENMKRKYDHFLQLALTSTREVLAPANVSEVEIRLASQALALAMLYRSISFASFVSLTFSGTIILSVHATVNAGPKYTLNLFPMKPNPRHALPLLSELHPLFRACILQHQLEPKALAPYHCARAFDVSGRALPITKAQGDVLQGWMQRAHREAARLVGEPLQPEQSVSSTAEASAGSASSFHSTPIRVSELLTRFIPFPDSGIPKQQLPGGLLFQSRSLSEFTSETKSDVVELPEVAILLQDNQWFSGSEPHIYLRNQIAALQSYLDACSCAFGTQGLSIVDSPAECTARTRVVVLSLDEWGYYLEIKTVPSLAHLLDIHPN